MTMKFLHTMIRVHDIDAALDFFVDKLGMIETRRKENEGSLYPDFPVHRRRS